MRCLGCCMYQPRVPYFMSYLRMYFLAVVTRAVVVVVDIH